MSDPNVIALERAPSDGALPEGARLGWVSRVDDEGIWVETEELDAPALALCVVPLSRADLEAAIADRRDAVILFVVGSGQPVLLGLRQPTPAIDVQMQPEGQDLDATVDGRKVRLEGKDEIVLRCGKASITMRRNGRIVIRGVQVESRATGRNRIKGGAVLIN